MTDQHTPFDTRLERVLGTGSLSPEQRRRHLDRIAERSRAGRFSTGRLLRDGAVVIVLIALLAGAWAMLPLGESGETDPMAAVAEMKEDISEPEPGTVRYTSVSGSTDLPPGVPDPEYSAEVWERVTDDGLIERAIKAYSADGQLIGRTVETTEGWVVETPGNQNAGRAGEPMIYPPEMFSALAAVQITVSETLSEDLESPFDEANVNATEENGLIILTISNPDEFEADAADLGILSEQIGFSVAAIYMELTFDTEAQQMVKWRWYIEDDQGEQHEAQIIRFDIWKEIEPAEIPDDAFADYTELSEQALIVPLPDRIELSLGTLEARDINTRSADRASITYSGPAPLLIEVQMYPLNAPDRSEFDGNTIELDGIDGHWRADQLVIEWPRQAVWEDNSHRYWLNARNLPEGGWTEDDLYELIEAIDDHNNS